MHRTTPTEPNAALLVSVAEAAAMLALSVVTIRRLVKDRTIPSVRIGAAVRIPRAAVHALAMPIPFDDVRDVLRNSDEEDALNEAS